MSKNHRRPFAQLVLSSSRPHSTIPRSKKEHEELDDLNNKFSERLEKIEKRKEEQIVETSR
ncbi:hypothetical protein RhiirA1_478648 [Rhizophagus irregularis]|uniref:Uncharacterized protein n=1 Tax=Rhizophagus irregularis TaxID=588596 RepID=A0A2N0QRR0_9GLOM|nr:hypothetical protein RhiirA1_478648 [Rhizophagus irregularis]